MKIIVSEYGPMTREGFRFGYGQYCTANPAENTEEAFKAEALKLGWSNGCPQARALTGPNSEYGLEWMMNRYAETNYWFRLTLQVVRKANPAVHQWLFTPRMRLLPFEHVGIHEPISVPASHWWSIAPMSGVEGYATPRVLIEIERKLGNRGRSQTLEMLNNVARSVGYNPELFLPLISEKAIMTGVSPVTVFNHVYPQGILEEENCVQTYQALAARFESFAPNVWREYLNLSAHDKESSSIADIPSIHP